jgi:hypothetical protein
MAAMVPVVLALVAAAPVRIGYVVELPAEATRNDIDATMSAIVDARHGVELLTRTVFDASEARTCGADVECLARELRYDEVDLVAIVVGAPVGDGVRIVSRLLDTRRAEIVARDARTGRPPLDDAFRASIEQLLDVHRIPRLGRLTIAPALADARVLVEDDANASVAVGFGPHVLPPGRYRVRATREDHEPFTSDVDVTGGDEARVDLRFAPVEPGWYASPWFWVVTAGVVVGGALVGVAVASSGGDRCVCIGRDPMQCPPPC